MKLSFLFLLTLGFTLIADTLLVGWQSSPPYQYYSADSQLTGMDIDIMKAVLDSAGLIASYKEAPWSRQLLWIQSGQLHIIEGASKTKEREEYGYFSVPYRYEEVMLYIRKSSLDSITITAIGDITKVNFGKLGVFQGSYYGAYFEQLKANPDFAQKLSAVNSDKQNLMKLKAGRIDGFLMDPLIAKKLIEKEHLEELIIAYPMPALKVSSLHFLYSRKKVSPELVHEIDSVINLLKSEQVIDSIIKLYY